MSSYERTPRYRATAKGQANLERDYAQRRKRYDSDPIYRISKRLRDDAHARAATVKRMEVRHRTLPDKR